MRLSIKHVQDKNRSIMSFTAPLLSSHINNHRASIVTFTSLLSQHEPTITSSTTRPRMPHVFCTFYDHPTIPTESIIFAFLALNNTEDTLAQSHMFQAHDASYFIKAQQPEIKGLKNMNVFDYHPIHSLPTNARLLSSIWSYERKRRPSGELIKHKVCIYVNGSQQLYGRDYWETCALVVT